MPEPFELTFTTVKVDARGAVRADACACAAAYRENLGDGLVIEMVAVLAGRFLMGSPPGQGYPDEWPQHEVNLPAFYVGRYPVTQSQWVAVMGGPAPFRHPGPARPAENVSWHAAQAFCLRLAAKAGHPFTLPSEAQWEYACRAGSAAAFSFGEVITTDLANYVGDQPYGEGSAGVYRHTTTDVGSFPANAFGLCDMHGNVWEWCADTWHPDYSGAPFDGSAWVAGGEPAFRVARGGSWHDGAGLCRSAARLRLLAREADDMFGFRVCAPA